VISPSLVAETIAGRRRLASASWQQRLGLVVEGFGPRILLRGGGAQCQAALAEAAASVATEEITGKLVGL
jgi:hypothetical protein